MGPGPGGDGQRRRPPAPGRILGHLADADHDGAVTAEEWKSFVGGIGSDEKGVISAESLAKRLPEPPAPQGDRPRPDAADRTAHLLKALDRDGNGSIDVKDLEAIFKEADRNGDGALDGAEMGPPPRGPEGGPPPQGPDGGPPPRRPVDAPPPKEGAPR